MLSSWSLLPLPLAKNEPRVALAPRCGTIRITIPPVSVSPRTLAVVTVTSCACAVTIA